MLENQKMQILALARAPREKMAWQNLFAFWSNRSLGSDKEHFDDDVLSLHFLFIKSLLKKKVFRSSKNLVNFAGKNINLWGPSAG